MLESEYLECWKDVPQGKGFTKPGRQILHCTFGSVLTNDKFGAIVRDCLDRIQILTVKSWMIILVVT